MWPSFQAVHHWTPQFYNPRTGYVYEPTLEMPAVFGNTGVDLKHYNPRLRTGDYTGLTVGSGDVPADAGHSVLKAWDPIHSRVVSQVETAGVSNGGTLATGGDLFFQGLAEGPRAPHRPGARSINHSSPSQISHFVERPQRLAGNTS